MVGTNAATKSLSRFLDCTKQYRAIGLLGSSTDSYDSDGKWVRKAAYDSITREKVESVLGQFRGEIEQTPPVCVPRPRLPRREGPSDTSHPSSVATPHSRWTASRCTSTHGAERPSLVRFLLEK